MQRVYKNVAVWDASRSSAQMCDVLTEGSKIKSILPAGSITAGCAYEGRGNTALLPGFVNAHGHSAMTLLRGLGEDLPLMDWLKERIWPVENKLNGELVYIGAKQAMMEMLSTGTTCFADMYFFMDKVAKAALETGMRCGLSRGIVDDKDGGKLADNIKLADEFNGAKGLVNIQLGPHAPYTLTFETMKKIASAAIDKKLAVQLHWLETSSEWIISGMAGKMTPEQYLEQTGMTSVPHLLLAHGIWVSENSMDFYNRDNITIAHNPKSNLKLGSGIAPLPEYLKHGVSVAIGTDGGSSNNRLDMWEELRFAALTQKGITHDPTLIKAEEVLKMATVNGARALGFEETGLIKEGYNADMILIDLDQPQYIGWNLDNLPGYIVYAGSSSDIRTTVVNGEILYDGGEFMTLDRKAVMREAAEARKKLTGK